MKSNNHILKNLKVKYKSERQGSGEGTLQMSSLNSREKCKNWISETYGLVKDLTTLPGFLTE